VKIQDGVPLCPEEGGPLCPREEGGFRLKWMVILIESFKMTPKRYLSMIV